MLSIEKWREEDGATAVEYGLLVGLIAVFLITAMTNLGDKVGDTFDKAACKVSGKIWNDTTQTCS
ncbi:MAG: Flp family type IVb pilin [Actinobacteria bacterium]|jgi:pilus assembly protein Flp/PilA|nr:Flp family type IVb pilin [Actinomycetota bacterium]NCV95873.1 Flp family type IVb pilin [Actinomycetota bacterium]NCW47415.1 Flp family type IVb pilin [Actinomycetota bacterium]NCW75738.1 Flp family type IVb pilin [Actinomycetota bacterium]NCW97051.1 Flp family type IVb pilin [Actinomycetota bacterium]